ncbi:MAG: hypothetical protein HY554_06480 [Elusimicrobia bacterium]|nr:hypothetical protein [Elusimicrobiota bacterium]
MERRSWPIEEGVFTTHRLDAINGGPTVLTRTEHLRRRALSFRIDREGRVEPAALERTWSILQSPEAGAVIERDVRSVQVAATLKEELEFWRQTLEGRGPKVALTDSELRRFRELADDAWRHKYRRMCKGEVLGAKECFQVISPGRGKPKVFRLSLFQDLKACDSNEVEASRFDIAADGTIDPVVHGIYDRPGFCSPIKRFYASLEDPWSQALVTKKIRFWLFF